ncbi:pentapeptide repeat-containing protein [Tomitella cavernea]|uniref:Pentapeptide repeat-containing protein n=1 Tax=Tomitella cavernea TaxID=1387982 RepID=A0ABP9D0A8_9ACTN|nr:pentapeptide repeat-containing protein [Tomitella cavernea]
MSPSSDAARPGAHTTSPLPLRRDLRADCRRCRGLCCTLLGFTRSADFAVDKPAGTPCRNLAPDHSCRIHDSLHGHGYAGCAAFDCFGAGQAVSESAAHRGGQADPRRMADQFAAARRAREMLWHLREASTLTYDPDTAERIDGLAVVIARLAASAAHPTEVEPLRPDVRALLADVSAEVRVRYNATGEPVGADLAPGADLAGRDLTRDRLCGADLSGALLIAADLRRQDCTGVDLLGADLRAAQLHGADLSRALYFTASQVGAALGDARTLLPPDIPAPAHWVR